MSINDLIERIARILNDEGWTFEGVHEPGDYDGCEDCRRVVDPIAARIAEEITTEARAQVDRVRELLTKLVDEYSDPVYHGNGWAEGVRDAAREALKELDGER